MLDRIGDNFLLAFTAMIEGVSGRPKGILQLRQGSPPGQLATIAEQTINENKLGATKIGNGVYPRCNS
ncbi:MAG TPA: hypothetical protein VIE66_01520 [Methylocella sp.]|jgi:hypothetical protein